MRPAPSRIEANLATAQTGYRMIIAKIEEMAVRAGSRMVDDPLQGKLANVDPEDYKILFRPHFPEAVQHALDHHILEARRVRRFVEFLKTASETSGAERKKRARHGGASDVCLAPVVQQ